jgi:hypothetical protein
MEPAAAPAAKPKRVLSDEQKAKMAAGRAAAKARRDAEKAAAAEAAPPAEKPKRVLSDEQKAKMAAGRAAAKAHRDAEKANAVPAAAPAAEAAEKPAKPKRTLSDEQKAKMAAGRAAARERKAAEKGAAAPAAAAAPVEKPVAAAAPAEPETEVVEVHLVDWEHDFGTGSKTYKRLDDEGMTYIYDHETRKYLGAYVEKTNKLKPSVPDPLAADD